MRPGPCPTIIGQMPPHAAWLVAIMLASAPAWAASESGDDPPGATRADRSSPAVAPAPVRASGPGDLAADLVLAAMHFLDVPYRRGGNDAGEGFDCSGFTRHVFGLSLGLVLPRRADEQASAQGLVSVERSELQSGDLVFFNTLQRSFSHVGIYIGEGKFIHAPRSGAQVRIEDMRFAYWAQRFTGARRAAALPAAGEATLLSANH